MLDACLEADATRERIVVIERRAVAWELRGRTCGAPIGSRVQGEKGKSASLASGLEASPSACVVHGRSQKK